MARSGITGCHHVYGSAIPLHPGKGKLQQDQGECRVSQATDREGGDGPEEGEEDMKVTITGCHWHARLV